jgi:hypothetical protein
MPFGLDGDGWAQLDRLTGRMVRHLHFEYLGYDKLRYTLREAAGRYKNSPDGQRPAIKQFGGLVKSLAIGPDLWPRTGAYLAPRGG